MMCRLPSLLLLGLIALRLPAFADAKDLELAKAHYATATAYYSSQRYEEAIREFKEAFRLSGQGSGRGWPSVSPSLDLAGRRHRRCGCCCSGAAAVVAAAVIGIVVGVTSGPAAGCRSDPNCTLVE